MKFRPNCYVPFWGTTCRGLRAPQKFLARCKLVCPQLLEGSCGGLRQCSGQEAFGVWGVVVGVGVVIAMLFPFSTFAQVIISEIMYDASGSDAKSEWIELQNIGTSSVDIAKWKINDGSNHVLNAPPKNGSTGTTMMEAGAYLILASDAATFSAQHMSVGVSIIDTTLSLSNDGETISLINGAGTAEDKVKYSTSKGADGTGESLQKISGKFSAASPTPGAANVARQKVAAIPVEKKTVATKSVPATKQGTSRVRAVASAAVATPGKTKTEVVSNADFVATTSLPQKGSENILTSPWLFGALAAGVAGSAAALVARKKKQGEWDIEEITDDV